MLIYNCKIKTMTGENIENGFVRITENIISEVGRINKPADEYSEGDINGNGFTLYPGFIDAHCHLGIFGDGIGFESMDANEITDPITPHLRAIDAVNPCDRCFEEALLGGVTTVVTGVGSANPMGGSLIAMKTYGGKRIDSRIMKSPLALKISLGENPKMTYHDRDELPTTRMSTAAIIREQLYKAKRYFDDTTEYLENKKHDSDFSPPEYDAKCEALIPLFKKEIKAHIHCHRADDIFTAMRICKEFDIEYVLVHVTEGGLIAEELKNEKCILGPIICDRSKPELRNLDTAFLGVMEKQGINFAICTDHPVIPIQYLPLCCGIAIKGGLSVENALRGITVNAAEIAGISDRVGTIEVGKDADLLLFKGNFYDVLESPSLIVAGGRMVKNTIMEEIC